MRYTHPASQAEHGKKLIPHLVDDLAQTKPDHIFAVIPKTTKIADGFQNVTIRSFARAVDEVAHRIDSSIGKNTDFETIAYIGPVDLRYSVVALAATKTGYKASHTTETLLPSPRNSIEGLLSLLDSTHCQYMLSAPGAKVDQVLSKRPMHHHIIDTFDSWVRQESVEHYPYNKTFEEGAHDPFIVIHTSGSTGLPKPITVHHGGLVSVDAHRLLPTFDGFQPLLKLSEIRSPERVFVRFPPFHIAGIMLGLTIPLCYEQTTVWPPTDRPLSAELIDELLDHVKVDGLILGPSVLEDMSQSQASLERLAKVKHVVTGGGPLTQRAGDTITRYTIIRNMIGSSEAAFLPLYDKEPEDWIYFRFDPRMEGIQFREVDGGLFGQVLIRHPSTNPYHSVWHTFPNASEYISHDLFSNHPIKPHMWLYEGRSDDMMVLSNGEKFNPGGMEAILHSHPEVAYVLVVGQARFQPAALIQLRGHPSLTAEAKKEMLDSLGQYIDKANEIAPAFAKLQRELITFTDPGQQMILTDKGTAKRAATTKAHEHEIDQLYADAEISSTSMSTIRLDARDLPALGKAVLETLSAVTGLKDLNPDQDVFAAGMDSLQVINLVRQLKSYFSGEKGGIAADLISPRIIYSNPTATKLAAALHQLTDSGEGVYRSLEKERVKKMEDMLARYARDPSSPSTGHAGAEDHGITVVLTGSTGSLGSYLLDALLASTQVSKVICLNRGIHGEDKQRAVNASRGLISEWGDRVQFLRADLGKPRLGLSQDQHSILVEETSVIIHNQWQVDFNLSLDSFEPHIAGVRDLIALAAQAVKKPPIFFTSSISTLVNWSSKHPHEKVPESAFHDFTIPAAMGYAESKYVSERLLELATREHSVSAAVIRVGQLAGPVVKDGVWSKQEWLPSTIASSKYLGKIPTTLPGQDDIPWVPVDLTARIIVELLLADLASPLSSTAWLKHYNLVNPHPGNWSSLIPTVMEYISAGASTKIEPVPFAEWLRALEATAARTEDLKKNPGIKLLDFFGPMAAGPVEVQLETEKTVARSETMRGLSALGPAWMKIWLKQWDF